MLWIVSFGSGQGSSEPSRHTTVCFGSRVEEGPGLHSNKLVGTHQSKAVKHDATVAHVEQLTSFMGGMSSPRWSAPVRLPRAWRTTVVGQVQFSVQCILEKEEAISQHLPQSFSNCDSDASFFFAA